MLHGIPITGAHGHFYSEYFWWYWIGAAIITFPINIYMHIKEEDMSIREAIVPCLMLSVFFGLGEVIAFCLFFPFYLLSKLIDK